MRTNAVSHLTYRSFLIGLLFLLAHLSQGQSPFRLDATNLKHIALNKSLSASGNAYQFASAAPITGLAISGTVTLKNAQGFVRVLLEDQNGQQYLVYEANSFTQESLTSTFDRFGEESHQLPNVKPAVLKVELAEAVLSMTDIYYVPSVAGSFRLEQDDSLRIRQAAEKAAVINAQIKKKGQKWVAGVTPIALMSYEQKKTLFSGKVPNLQGAEYYKGGILSVASAGASSSVAPKSAGASPYIASFDWRNRHGQNWITHVEDQGGCGSCWAFCATGTTEQALNLYFNRHLNLDLSEQAALSCSNSGTCAGGNPGGVFEYYKNTGAIEETCFPYTATDQACSNKCASPTQLVKITNYEDFNPADGEDKLKSLIIRGAVSGGLISWWHCMNLVGYKTIQVGDKISLNDPGNIVTIQPGDPLIGKTVWIFKNSWGEWWGDNGYVIVDMPMDNFYLTHSVYGTLTSKNHPVSSIQCTDADGDGYYFWGLGPKPAHCPASPAEADGDDSNPNLGPLDQYGYCRVLGQQYTVTTAATNGTITLSPSGGSYAANTVVTATAVPNAGYKFQSWGGALSGTTNPTNLTVNANKSISATFKAIPVLSIISPTANSAFYAPANVTIKATASIAAGATISKVEFFNLNGATRVKLGESTSGNPCAYTWANVGIGNYTVIVKATASNSEVAEQQVSFYVTGPNTPPTVSWLYPANNAVFDAPASFELSVSATDQQTPISKVEFYQGAVKLGEDIYYPGFSWYVSNLTPGTYTFTAVAFDGGGLSTTTTPLTVKVQAPACVWNEPTPNASQWVVRNDWYDQSSGSSVSNGSGALKVTHRAYGQNSLWVIENPQFPVVSGKTYAVSFDFLDAPIGVAGIEVGFATGVGANGPVLAQSTVSVPNGYSNTTFTTKTVNIISSGTRNVSLAFKLKWASQPTAQVIDYIKNVKVCVVGSGSFRSDEEEVTEVNAASTLSPNPVDDRVEVRTNFSGADLEILDGTGTLVKTIKMSAATAELDVRELASGMYFVLLKGNGEVQKLRFVKR